MKKVAVMMLVIVLMITVFVTAFARQVNKCPICDGEYYSTRVIKDWHEVRGRVTAHFYREAAFHWDGPYWQERTVAIVCSNGTHANQIEKKDCRAKCDVDPVLWGWTR